MKITVLGSSNIDMCARVSQLPAPGQTIGGASFMEAYGGKGANQAVAAARLGADVCFLAAVGGDSFGKAMIDNFKAEGIDTSGVITMAGEHSGLALIMIAADGENSIAVCPGANGRFTPGMLDSLRASIESADMLVMQAEIPYETVKRAARIAREAGVPVLYNPAPVCAVDDEMMALVDILIVNEGEGTAISGVAGDHEAIARALLARGASRVVVTLGSKGAYACDGGEGMAVPSFKVKAVDAVGAGDTFCGALAVAVCRSGKLDADALRFASAAAALSVTRAGAQPSIPTLAETEAFIAERL